MAYIPTHVTNQESINPKHFGAVGNGVADDTAAIQAACDYAFGPPGAPLSTTSTRDAYRGKVFLPPGFYRTTAAINLRSIYGGEIAGAGRSVTKIRNETLNGHTFLTNGFSYSRVAGMEIAATGTGSCFNLDWDNTGDSALQSNTFEEILFQSGAHGLVIGASGNMGSENLIKNCFFANHTAAGLATYNYNALQNIVLGGNFQGCAIGIYISSGSVSNVVGVGFQISTTWDIKVDNGVRDTMLIHGVRSESVNFALIRMQGASIIGVNHIGPGTPTNGTFVDTSYMPTRIQECASSRGKVRFGTGDTGFVENFQVGRDDWLQLDSGRLHVKNIFAGKDLLEEGSGTAIFHRSGYFEGGGTPPPYFSDAKGIVPITTSRAVTTNESDRTLTNEGATAEVNLTLPPAVSSRVYRGIVVDADGLRFTAAAGDTIRVGTAVSAAAGNVVSTEIGSTIKLEAINATEWFATLFTGAWLVDNTIVGGNDLYGSVVYDPPSLADGEGVTTTLFVSGVALGDLVVGVSFSLHLQGFLITAFVSSENIVSVRFQNETGGVFDMAEGTIRVIVRKKT